MITSSKSCIGVECREPHVKRNATTNTTETIHSHEDFLCSYHFTSGWHSGTAVGTQAAVQVSPKWLTETIPTDMRWTEIEHYCNPMESQTPPYGLEPFLRMWRLREKRDIMLGLWKCLWNYIDDFIMGGPKKCIYLCFLSLGRESAI